MCNLTLLLNYLESLGLNPAQIIEGDFTVIQARASQIIYALLISVSIYLAYGTRSIGLVLIPCLFVYHVIKSRRPSLFGGKTYFADKVHPFLIRQQSHLIRSYYVSRHYYGIVRFGRQRSRALFVCKRIIGDWY